MLDTVMDGHAWAWISQSVPERTYPMLLHRDIGKVDKHIVELTEAGIVLHSAETAEPQAIPAPKRYKLEYTTNWKYTDTM